MTEPWGEKPAERRLRIDNEYAAWAERRDEAERVTPLDAPDNPAVEYLPNNVFYGYMRDYITQMRYQHREHNEVAWCNNQRQYTQRQRQRWAEAADAIEALIEKWNQQDKEERS